MHAWKDVNLVELALSLKKRMLALENDIVEAFY